MNKSKQQAPTSGFNAFQIIVVFSLVTLIAMGFLMNQRLSALEGVGEQPGILVVDYDMAMIHLVEQGDEQQIAEGIGKLNEGILALQDAGYIVLAGDNVLAAPTANQLDFKLILEGE